MADIIIIDDQNDPPPPGDVDTIKTELGDITDDVDDDQVLIRPTWK